MVDLPWLGGDGGADAGGADAGGADPAGGIDVDPVVSCEFQDGTLFVYEDHVHVERAAASKFDDKSIGMDEIGRVEYSGGLVMGYLQIGQVDFESDSPGVISAPVDENTLHFGRADRDCATRARDAILERGRAD